MLAHVIDTWREAGFEEIVVVLGKDSSSLREMTQENFLPMGKREGSALSREADLGSGGVRFVENPDWESGMFSSVQCGLSALRECTSTHIAVAPADLPFLRSSSLRTILEATNLPEADSRTLLVPICGRRRGHPLVIPAALAARVLAWPADARLNRLFAEPDVKVLHLEGFDDSILHDVDAPGDLVEKSLP